MEKAVAQEIKTGKRQEKEDRWTKQVVELGSIAKRFTLKNMLKYNSL
jgi:hypothetical protein